MENVNPSLPAGLRPAGLRTWTPYRRPLGPLETMYHVYYKRGMDIYAQMVHLKCEEKVDNNAVKVALICLMKRHPLLRMRIEECDIRLNKYNFVEMDDYRINLFENCARNWETVLNSESCTSFDTVNGPMWRLTVLRDEEDKKPRDNSNTGRKYDFRFVFAFHHSLADGMYLRQLFADFIEYLDLVQRDIIYYNEIKETDFLPPIENCLPFITKDALLHNEMNLQASDCSGTMNHKKAEALNVYEAHFAEEIQFLRTQGQKTESLRLHLPRQDSLRFLSQCKQHHVTVTGACVAAACRSLAIMLKPTIPETATVLRVPVEVMVNMRRYVVDRTLYEAYPGVAAIHVAVIIEVPLRENLNCAEVFWYLAKQCTEDINNMVASGKPLGVMSREVTQEINSKGNTGKSQYVICLTNMASADGVVKQEQKNRFHVENFPAMTQIGIDDMPIFYVGIHSIYKQIHLDVGHCSRYTSKDTASKFSWNIMSSFLSQNRL